MKRYIVEFIGTFFLVLTVALTGNPIAIGAVLVALVYMGGYISGAHYNPAVTLALWVNKKITSERATYYIVIQMLAGIVASGVYFFIQNKMFLPELGQGVSGISALSIEVLFTFLLASVVLHTAATEKTKGNQYFGLAIGLTVLAGAFAGGPISGGAFNPAVGISPLLFDITHIQDHMINVVIYLIGPIVGGMLAGLVYKFLLSVREV
jgi:glycerol uptake facilitator-like aquaporin